MKKYLKILAIVVVVLLVVGVTKDFLIKVSIENGVNIVTGLKLKIGSIKVGIFRPVVDIKNLKLLNPTGFPDRTMIDMPEIYVNYDLPAILGGKIHLREVRINLKEFYVVKNVKGELNLNALKPVQAQKEGKSPSQISTRKAPEIRIDYLKLTIGTVTYKDYSKPGAPDIKEFNVNLNESYANINDPYELASLIVVKALMNTSISSLTNFDLNGLKGTVGDALYSARKIVSKAGDAAKTASQIAKEAEDVAQKTIDTVKNVFKSPF